MAKKEDLDLKDDKPAGSSKKMIIIFAIVGIVLIGASVGVTIMLVGGKSGDAEGGEHATEKAAEHAPAPAAHHEPHYFSLKPLVVNFAEKGPARFLQVEMDAMVYDPVVVTETEKHMPVIRNNLLVLLGSQTFEQISTREGKEKLQADIVAEINKVLQQQASIHSGVEKVFFTNFVMQ